MDLQKTESNQQVALSTPAAFSHGLLQCLIKLETAERTEAKLELVMMTNELMPKGKPDLLGVIKFPMIRDLVQTEGKKKMLAVLVLLVKDFCSSINVVRNMNEDQMIEAAAMLLEECDNFRMEDYVMMFTMAKRGEFHPEVKIYDRVDIQVISAIMDAYWDQRKEAGRRAMEEQFNQVENGTGESQLNRQQLVWKDENGYVQKTNEVDSLVSLSGAIEALKAGMQDNHLLSEEEAIKQLMKNTNYKNPFPKPDES